MPAAKRTGWAGRWRNRCRARSPIAKALTWCRARRWMRPSRASHLKSAVRGNSGSVAAAGWVIAGTVRRTASELRARVEIFEVPTATMSAAELTSPREDLAAFQNRFVALIERALGIASGPASYARPLSIEAHECYTRARVLVDRMGKASMDDARALLERAIAIDERHVDARITLAGTYALRSVQTGDPDDLRRALEMVEDTLAREPDHAWAHVWKGYVLMRQGRIAEAEPAFRRALALNPDHAEAHYFAAALLLWSGRPGRGAPDHSARGLVGWHRRTLVALPRRHASAARPAAAGTLCLHSRASARGPSGARAERGRGRLCRRGIAARRPAGRSTGGRDRRDPGCRAVGSHVSRHVPRGTR